MNIACLALSIGLARGFTYLIYDGFFGLNNVILPADRKYKYVNLSDESGFFIYGFTRLSYYDCNDYNDSDSDYKRHVYHYLRPVKLYYNCENITEECTQCHQEHPAPKPIDELLDKISHEYSYEV